MKARVKATGEIVEVAYHGLGVYVDINQRDKEYQFDEIVVLDNGDPDYWEKLKHQYAGMAMQGILANPVLMQGYAGLAKAPITSGFLNDYVLAKSVNIAHELVMKFMEESKC